MALATGDLLQERYRIMRRLGSGGFSTVYLAADQRLGGRHVAIKEMSVRALPPAERTRAADLFWQEAQLLAQFKHPGIIHVSDFFHEGEDYYLAMEYVEGPTLGQLLDRQTGRRLPLNQALQITRQIAGVLTHLHSYSDPQSGGPQPIIYRDLKPANVIVQADGAVKLLDFGIARFFKPGQTSDTRRLGTPGYAAPEQYGEQQSDARTDVYSLGVLLHEMLTGYDPAQSPLQLPPVASLNPEVPAQIAGAIGQATQVAPDQRFNSIAAFARALGISLPLEDEEEETILLPSLERASPFSRTGLLIAGVVLLLLLLIPLGLRLLSAPAAEEPPTAAQPVVVVTATPESAEATALAEVSAPTTTPTPSTTATPTASATPTATPSATPTLTPTPGPAFSGVYFCMEACAPDGSNATTTFPGASTRIYTHWQYQDIPVGSHYERIWTNQGDLWAHYDCTWPGPSSGVDTVTLTDPAGLRSGIWEVTIRVDGQVAMQEQITLTGNVQRWSPAGYFDSCYGKR